MNALLISSKDNVAVVTEPVRKGTTIEYVSGGVPSVMIAATDVPVYHKAATRDIETGEKIIKYGYVIGMATEPIKKGEHVHCHNVVSAAEGVKK